MDTDELFDLVEELVEESSLLLVDMSAKNVGRTYHIRILVDRPGRVTIDECAGLSRKVKDSIDGGLLVMNENYRLEVSSPGIGRPLSSEVDWIRSVGRELSVELQDGSFTSTLEDYTEGRLRFQDEREVAAEDIVRAVEVLD